jgi:hypothetical protein
MANVAAAPAVSSSDRAGRGPRAVACTHVSNILGTIHDIKSIAALVHTVPGAEIAYVRATGRPFMHGPTHRGRV